MIAKGILNDPNLLRLPTLIMAGSNSPEADEARRIAKRIESMKKQNQACAADYSAARMADAYSMIYESIRPQ